VGGGRLVQQLTEELIEIARGSVIAGLLVAAGLLLAGVVTTTQTAYAAGVLVLAVLVALLPRDLWEGLAKLSIGPFAAEWVSDAKVAATNLVAEEDEAAGTDVLDLRLRLEAKLGFIATRLLGDPQHPALVTIGSLMAAGYLTREEARTAIRILTATEPQLLGLPALDRATFLKDASRVVGRIRAHVFQKVLRDQLAAQGWDVSEIARPPNQPDLLADKDGRRYRIAGVFADKSKSKLTGPAVERLAEEAHPAVERRIVVVPTLKETRALERVGDPAVMQLGSLTEMLQGSVETG
jgi:hypothetical protein